MGIQEPLSIPEIVMRADGEIKPETISTKNSKIVEFYKGKSVFVTGGTGFLGKLLIEKLLRACDDIEMIYILVRSKKGDDEITRTEKLFSDVVFTPLRKYRPKFQYKLAILKGDLSLPDLGLSNEDKQLIIDKVNIIFHIAATVRFDEKIKLATTINVRGTRDLLQIARKCKNLMSFVHISTAFSYCPQKEIDEKFYKPTISAEDLIELTETTCDEQLDKMTDRLVGDWPNTYVFTKAIAENAIEIYGTGLPVCIIRPSVVVSTYREPLRNWIDNVYGATGILVGCGMGILRSVHCVPTNKAEIIPADFVTNTIISASYKTGTEITHNDIPIYNTVSSVENPIDWNNVMNKSKYYGLQVPSAKCIWYYSLKLNPSKIIHTIYVIFLHFLPGIIADAGLLLLGKKPMLFKAYRKITKFESVISHFCTNEWKYSNANVQSLWRSLGVEDKKVFPFSLKEFDWEDYHKTHLFGLRKYIVKESDSTLPEGRRRYRKLFYAHTLLKIIGYIILIRLIYSALSMIINILL